MGMKVLFNDGQEFDFAGVSRMKRAEGSYCLYSDNSPAPRVVIPTEQVRYITPYDDAEKAKMEKAVQASLEKQAQEFKPPRPRIVEPNPLEEVPEGS